ncbi:hypothetical protein HKD37_07G020265 [Glycine soja]
MENLEEEQHAVVVYVLDETIPDVLNESSYEFVVNDDVNAKEQETGCGDDDKDLLLVNNGLFEESDEIVPIIIDGLVDIVDINMMNITSDEVERFLFGPKVAYLFYY